MEEKSKKDKPKKNIYEIAGKVGKVAKENVKPVLIGTGFILLSKLPGLISKNRK